MVTENKETKEKTETKKSNNAGQEKKVKGAEKSVEKKEVKTKKKEKVDVKAEKKKPKTRKRKSSSKKKKGPKCFVARGKRKTAVARASVKDGRGNLRINKNSINSINNKYVRDLILEPLKLAGEKALKVDISVNVFGGGVLGQAQAVRTAIAKAMVAYFDDQSLKTLYLGRDRSLLIEDSRRVESKKFKGPKARARFQKSFR